MEFVVEVNKCVDISPVKTQSTSPPDKTSPSFHIPKSRSIQYLQLASKQGGRRVSIDVIDTSLLPNSKSPEELEEERLDALKEVNIFDSDSKIPKSNIFDNVLQLVSRVVKSTYLAATLVGSGEIWDAASCGIGGDEIPSDVLYDVIISNEPLILLDAQQDPRFSDSNFGFYAGIPLRHKNKFVGVFSVVDYRSIPKFGLLSINVIEDAGKLIIDQLQSSKTEMDAQRNLLIEVEEQKRLLRIQEELRSKAKRAERSSEASPRRGLVELEDIYSSWIEEDVATGDQLAHLPWAANWDKSYPLPPVLPNDKDRCDAAHFYRSIIEDPTRILFDEMCQMVCETLGFPMAVLGVMTETSYLTEASNGGEHKPMPREIALCNYTIKKGHTFVVPDVHNSPFFGQHPASTVTKIGFYASAPLCTSEGFTIGTICVCDAVARKDFNLRKQKQLGAFAKAFMRHLEIRRLKMLNVELNLEKDRLHKQLTSNKEGHPEGDVTFVCTDVENSTPLWEHHSAEMNQALKLHEQLIRASLADCYGYEIGTEGDSFELAFHSAVDAVRWCLIVQEKLVSLPWPEELLKSPYCKEEKSEDGRILFAGLRVRMAVHTSNDFEADIQKVSQRMRYFGAGVNAVRTLSAFATGGQILISDSTFELINGSLDNLGNPFIIDLGRHLLDAQNCEMNVYQLLPPSLGPTYTKSATNTNDDLSRNKVHEVISPSYFDAPRKGNVHLVFAVLDKHTRANLVDSNLMRPTHTSVSATFSALLAKYNGYICHEEHGSFMIAFHTSYEAAGWCIETIEALQNSAESEHKPTIQMGIHTGKSEDCRPHPVTGRMYYFGAVVNRTARIAHKAADGQLLVSKELILDLQQTTSATMKKQFLVQEEGDFMLKGIPAPVSLCSIIKRPVQ